MNKSTGINSSNIYIIFIFICIFIPLVGAMNSYIFDESNIFIYTILFCLYCIYNTIKINTLLFKRETFYIFLFFISYNIFSSVPVPNSSYNMYIKSLCCYFLLFVMGAILFYKKKYLTDLIWCFCLTYLFIYVARISMDIQAAIDGTNLSSGIVASSIFPFVLINIKKHTENYAKYSYIILFIMFLWCAMIGSRAVTLGLVIFGLTFWLWPVITKNKLVYLLYYVSSLILISTGVFYYIVYLTNPELTFFSDSGIGILSKRVGTRLAIWVHLVEVILQGDWLWGHGSNLKTSDLIPLSYLDFNENRKNLSSHSMIFETVYRVGVFGLSLFFLIIFSIWSFLWKSRKSNLTRIVCSTIMMLIPICYSSTFLVFSDFHLRCAFIWVLLGFGYGHTFVYSRQSITQAKCPV